MKRRFERLAYWLGKAAEQQIPHGEEYVGNPETHGIDEPRGGGFNIMQELQKSLVKEQKKTTASEITADVYSVTELKEALRDLMDAEGGEPDQDDEMSVVDWNEASKALRFNNEGKLKKALKEYMDAIGGEPGDTPAQKKAWEKAKKLVASSRVAGQAVRVPHQFIGGAFIRGKGLIRKAAIEWATVEKNGPSIVLTIKLKGEEPDVIHIENGDDWSKGWHNGVAKYLEVPMFADMEYSMWVNNNFEVENPRYAIEASVKSLKSRRAMYWGGPGRTYRLTREEQESGAATCPKCRGRMEKEPFTKGEKLYLCPECRFKVPSSKTTTTRIQIDVDPDGEVDVDVTTAGGKLKKAMEIGRRFR